MVFVPPPMPAFEVSLAPAWTPGAASERQVQWDTASQTMGGSPLGSINNPLNYKGGTDASGRGGAYAEYAAGPQPIAQYGPSGQSGFGTGMLPMPNAGMVPNQNFRVHHGQPGIGSHREIASSGMGFGTQDPAAFSQWLSTPGNNWWQGGPGPGPNLPGRVAGTGAGNWSQPKAKATEGSAGPGRTVAGNEVSKSFTFGLGGKGKGISFLGAQPQQQQQNYGANAANMQNAQGVGL